MGSATKSSRSGKRSFEQRDEKPSKKAKIPVDVSDDEELEDGGDSVDVSASSNSSEEDELDDISSGGGEEEDGEDEEETVKEDGSSNNHAEQRKVLKERKMQRRSGSEVQQIKSVWERLRVKNPAPPKEVRDKLANQVWELSKDCISDLVLKHDASRVVQTLVKYSSRERRDQIVNALKGKFYLLATSSYGKYLLVKLLHYGSKQSRQMIIDELHGSLRKLMRHREGAYVVEDLFVLYSTSEQRNQMIREFWGSEYAVFRDTHKGLTIEDVCNSSVEKRNIIARNLIGTITASVEKGSTGFQILHAAMREYVKIANDKEILELVELLHEQFAELVHTPEGADVACTLIARSGAKERKLILRTLKNHTEQLVKNEHGNLVFITILLCVDDTVLVFKSFGPSVKEHLPSFIIDKYGRRPWLYILLGFAGKYFSPLVMKDLERYMQMAETTSKKPVQTKRHELLQKFAPIFLKTIINNTKEIISENLGSQFVSEVLVNDELYESLAETEQEKFQKCIDAVREAFKGDISDESHLINHPFSARMLKSLIQGGKWNNKEKKLEPLKKAQGLGPEFALKVYADIADASSLLDWINNPNSSFTIVALYEALKDQKQSKTLATDLQTIKKDIDSTSDANKGAQLLLKLLN